MTAALMAGGAVAAFAAWRVVAAGRATPWNLITPLTAALGLAALLTGKVGLSPEVPIPRAVLGGLGAGIVLYAATAAFVIVIRRWPVFDRHVTEIYDQQRGLPLVAALLLAAAISAPSEELFWRGLFQGAVAGPVGWWAAAGLTWAAYVAVNCASGSLPIAAGAIVAGGVWGVLAVWTHGVLASILCHVSWTALMLIKPPGGVARPAAARGAELSAAAVGPSASSTGPAGSSRRS